MPPSHPNSPNHGSGFCRADLLLLIPFVWQLGFAPWANGVEWRPWGLPFQMVWQMAGILVATAAIALRYHLDDKHDGEEQEKQP